MCAEEDILDSIYSGEAMFGIDFCPAESEQYLKNELLVRNLSQEVFLESGMYILMDENHPLAQAGKFPMEALYDYPMAAFGENESRAVSFAAQAKAVGLELSRFHTLILFGDRATLYAYLKESGGVFITGLVSERDQKRYGLTAVPVEGFLRRYSVITPIGLELPAVCQELIEAVKASALRLGNAAEKQG